MVNVKKVYKDDVVNIKLNKSKKRRAELLPLYKTLLSLSKLAGPKGYLKFDGKNGLKMIKDTQKIKGGVLAELHEMGAKPLGDILSNDPKEDDYDVLTLKHVDDDEPTYNPYLIHEGNNDIIEEDLEEGENILDVVKGTYQGYKLIKKGINIMEEGTDAVGNVISSSTKALSVGTGLWDLSRGFKDEEGNFNGVKMTQDIVDIGVNFGAPELAPIWGLIKPLLTKAGDKVYQLLSKMLGVKDHVKVYE